MLLPGHVGRTCMLSLLSSFTRLVCCSMPNSLLMTAWLSELSCGTKAWKHHDDGAGLIKRSRRRYILVHSAY